MKTITSMLLITIFSCLWGIAQATNGSKYPPAIEVTAVGKDSLVRSDIYPRTHLYPTAYNYPRVYHYPRKHYVCFRVKRSTHFAPGRYKFYVQCSYQGWYSTAPYFRTYYHKIRHRPQYVCMRRNAHRFKRFVNNIDAVAWWQHNCNKWHYRRTPDLYI